MQKSSGGSGAFTNIPPEVWLRIVDILVQREHASDMSTSPEAPTAEQLANPRHLKCLIRLISTSRRLYTLVAPYVFLIFSGRILLWAAETGQREVVEDAIEAGAPIDVRNRLFQSPLFLAAKNGHVSIVDLLLALRSNRHLAALPSGGAGDYPVPAEWPNGKAVSARSSFLDIDAADKMNMTPLGEAAARGHDDVVKLLLNHGASVGNRIRDGQTPLHLAASGGRREVLQAFLHAKNTKWNAGDIHGCSPLFLAAANGHTSVIEFLRLHGGNAATTNHGDRTPLHIAAANGHIPVVKYLLLLPEVNPLLKDRHGYSPLDLAARNGHISVVTIFCSAHNYGVLATMSCLIVAAWKRLFQLIDCLRHTTLTKSVMCD